jgi:putative mRNA 3-end processing factor
MESDLLQLTDHGLYCPLGDFYVDPWHPVHRAVVTHAHSDHFANGCHSYLISYQGEEVFKTRLRGSGVVKTVPYGESLAIGEVKVSLHPAGHILGSAQVRIEHKGQVWVVSGDYKTAPDPTCEPFELVPCHTFITEATFGLPIFRWPAQEEVFAEINSWWRSNADLGRASILYVYALGKAQRVLAGLDSSIGPIYTHGAVEIYNQVYRASGVRLPASIRVTSAEKPDFKRALILAPASAQGTPWLRRFGLTSSGFASGWMRVRGMRRRRAIDRGFIISDHVDWPGLTEVIEATGASIILVIHGYVPVVVRWLRENGLQARALATRFIDRENETEGEEE